MSLAQHCRQRMVILGPRATVHEASRAMADNHIGSVLIAEEQRLTGIVTDRDLALDVIGGGLDPRATLLHDVMTDEVAAVDVGGTIEDVVRTMCTRACRRVPITDGERPVGLITLDDLVIARLIDVAVAGSIVAAQLEAGARLKPEGVVHPVVPARPAAAPSPGRALSRRKARADSARARLLKAVERHSGIGSHDRAEQALVTVLGLLCRRVTPEEARHLIAQLPSRMHPLLEPFLTGPDRGVTTAAIEHELERELGVAPDVAKMVLGSVGEAIAESVSSGEIEAFRGQLPLAMKDLLPPTPLRRAG
jgi:CBS domain-containing protein/uncharacterized protein (DUF2267 family)